MGSTPLAPCYTSLFTFEVPSSVALSPVVLFKDYDGGRGLDHSHPKAQAFPLLPPSSGQASQLCSSTRDCLVVLPLLALRRVTHLVTPRNGRRWQKMISLYIKGTLPKFIINPTPKHLAETGDGVMGFRWEKWGAGAAEMTFCLSESFYRGEVGPQVELL